jgi:hypothetical protein
MQFPDYKNSFGLLTINAQRISEGFIAWYERDGLQQRLNSAPMKSAPLGISWYWNLCGRRTSL